MGNRIFNKVRAVAARFWPELLFLGVALLILGAMLGPGYVFLMDMVFAPTVRFFKDYGSFYNSYPFQALLWLAARVMPVWVAQKLMLLGLLSAIGISAYRFLPYPSTTGPRIFGALVYLVNPFVYWRFLAGNIFLLWGYALLPLIVDGVLRMVREPSPRNAVRLAIALALLGSISLHLAVPLAAGVAIVCGVSVMRAGTHKAAVLRTWGVAVAVAAALSAYWILPYLWERTPVVFDMRHWAAFAPKSPTGSPVLAELATLNGFWGQARPWGSHVAGFHGLTSFWIAYGVLMGLVVAGCVQLMRKGRRGLALGLLGTGVAAIILGTGAADTPFRGFNALFAAGIPAWSGLRDSQKLIAFLALVYSVLAAWGMEFAQSRLPKARIHRTTLLLALLIVPISFGSLLWGGLHGQVRPSWYPDSWFELDTEIRQDPPGARTVFLPWYRYMYFRFAGTTLDNPARFFFGPAAIVSSDIGLDGIRDQETDPYYRKVDHIITNDGLAPDAAAQALAELGVTRAVVFKEPVVDAHSYPFLTSRHVVLESDSPEFSVFRIR